jgi:hypothetical protein
MGVRLAVLMAGAAVCLFATDVTGTVVITRRLTRARITPAASAYERGPAPRMPEAPSEDNLQWERRHVVVYLEGDLPDLPSEAVMEQKGRTFSPDLAVISAGSKVSFPNLDPIFHNVFSLSRAKAFDLGNYSNGQTRIVTFPHPGVVLVNCRLHPNMSAAIVVTPNAYSAVVDSSGNFTIHDVPPGRYTAVAWHKSGGTLRRTIRVTEASADPLEFEMPLAAPTSAIAAIRR